MNLKLFKASLFLALVLSLLSSAPVPASAAQEIPAKGMVTLVDLGSDQCLPCRLMMPILEELKAEYKGKAAIVILDVWANRNLGMAYGIRVIPTQVFFDRQGREVFRHEGFLSKENIQMILTKLGVEKPSGK